jgi:site-specific DNA-methyltransferase (adenine-specific)
MKPTLTIGNATIYAGNNLEVLPTLPDNSVDSIVCDPPYELGFMGKSWDSSGIAYSVELWRECLRVLKPGGHLLAFGGTRTWHRLAVAIEDAGFEIRDNIAWLYGSGFPKSHNVGNAIDKKLGMGNRGHAISSGSQIHPTTGQARPNGELLPKYEGRTPEGKKWDGWGTALKPAHEPIVVARKPLTGTVAENVLEHGVGGINVDACRIGTETRLNASAGNKDRDSWRMNTSEVEGRESIGRWPANIILDEYTAELLDEQSGITKTGDVKPHENNSQSSIFGNGKGSDWKGVTGFHKGDSGGASRFFYVAKANKRDRNEGLENIEGKEISAKGNGLARTCNTCGASTLDGCDCPDRTFSNPVRQNFHPTVKPTALMQYLIRLVTPTNGVVLDPFAGSGSTGKAAILEGKHFIGIEITPEYLPIIEGRLQHAYETVNSKEDLF